MGLTEQTTFSSGEIDPVLHERTTLNKYKAGLKTGRNCVVGKTGSLLSRQGREHILQCKLANRKVKGFNIYGYSRFLEWGHQYVRVYTYTGSLVVELAHSFVEDDLDNIHFSLSKTNVYIFCNGKTMAKIQNINATPSFVAAGTLFDIPTAPTSPTVTPAGTPAGYQVEYLVTAVVDGEESLATASIAGTHLIPVAAGQTNTIQATKSGADSMRVYRRPYQGNVFGFIGQTTYESAGVFKFTDFGQAANYSQNPPEEITSADPETLQSRTGTVYQQRLILSDGEVLYAGRTGFQNNFTRDFPYSSDSALEFKSGTEGNAEVLRMIDSDGLVVFTKRGVFLSVGALTPDNLALDRKGKWIIDETVPPLSVPGGVFFLDKATNTLRQLVWSNELATFNGTELSIFSNHLFNTRKVTSWAFQEGKLPLLYVTFDDGDFAMFTYEFDHEMKAWTRGDSLNINIEQVFDSDDSDTCFFIVEKGGNRYIEKTIPRYIPAAEFVTNPEVDKANYVAYMDSIVSYDGLLNGSLTGGDVFTLTPVTPGDWLGNLDLDCGTSGIFTDPGPGAVNEVLRVFDSDGASIDLKVVARTDNNNIRVQPIDQSGGGAEYDSTNATGFRLYRTVTTLSGLGHMEGEDVSVIVDGYVVATPLNNLRDNPTVTVSSGAITLPSSPYALRAAILHVGRPICGDVETLEINTVEQSPTLIESITVNKLYIKVYNSIGLYIGSRFPDNNDVKGADGIPDMEDIDVYIDDFSDDEDIVSNKYRIPSTKRIELTLPGDWSTQGKIALRGVDPLHWQILSIRPDVEVLKRSDRE